MHRAARDGIGVRRTWSGFPTQRLFLFSRTRVYVESYSYRPVYGKIVEKNHDLGCWCSGFRKHDFLGNPRVGRNVSANMLVLADLISRIIVLMMNINQ